MTMSREDVLRELELLPVWQLRVPSPQTLPQQVMQAEMPQVLAEKTEPQFRMIVSEDANYLFVLSPTQNQDEETLLQNMLKSIAFKSLMDIASQGIDSITQYSPKVIVAMGEVAAHSLLKVTESMEDLREKLHQTQNMQVVVTYHPSHLLLKDKAKAWQDLCFAQANINKN